MEDDTNLILKYIVEELSQEPFNYDLNAVAFASLSHEALFNVFHGVLREIDPRLQEGDEGGNTSVTLNPKKILAFLKVLRYWPKHNDPDKIVHALEQPVPEMIWEMMAWILQRKEELKQRAYLAQYLVKIPVPDEMLMDQEVSDCYGAYEEKIKEFKETHKRLYELKTQLEKKPVAVLAEDIRHIDKDIDSLSKKVDHIKKRMESISGLEDNALEKSRLVRKARETKARLQDQRRHEEEKLCRVERHLEFQQNLLGCHKDITQHATPEGALEKLRQDAEMLTIIVEERFPKNIISNQRSITAMLLVEENPPYCRSDLESMRLKLMEMRKYTTKLERDMRSNEEDPALSFARKKAAEGKKGKLELADELSSLKRNLGFLQQSLKEKLDERQSTNKDFPTQEGHKDYLKQMRIKSTKYKNMKAELQALQTEISQLSSTKFIADNQLVDSEADLKSIENKLGIVGFTTAQDRIEALSIQKSNEDQTKMQSIYEMATLAKQLNDEIVDQKMVLNPLMNDLKEQRKEFERMTQDLEELKDYVDGEMAPTAKNIERLEDHMKKINIQYSRDQVEYAKLQAELPVLKNLIYRAQDVAKNTEKSSGIRSYREVLLAKLAESERNKSGLTFETNNIAEEQAYDNSQKMMWENVSLIMKTKLRVKRNFLEDDVSDYYNQEEIDRHCPVDLLFE